MDAEAGLSSSKSEHFRKMKMKEALFDKQPAKITENDLNDDDLTFIPSESEYVPYDLVFNPNFCQLKFDDITMLSVDKYIKQEPETRSEINQRNGQQIHYQPVK